MPGGGPGPPSPPEAPELLYLLQTVPHALPTLTLGAVLVAGGVVYALASVARDRDSSFAPVLLGVFGPGVMISWLALPVAWAAAGTYDPVRFLAPLAADGDLLHAPLLGLWTTGLAATLVALGSGIATALASSGAPPTPRGLIAPAVWLALLPGLIAVGAPVTAAIAIPGALGVLVASLRTPEEHGRIRTLRLRARTGLLAALALASCLGARVLQQFLVEADAADCFSDPPGRLVAAPMLVQLGIWVLLLAGSDDRAAAGRAAFQALLAGAFASLVALGPLVAVALPVLQDSRGLQPFLDERLAEADIDVPVVACAADSLPIRLPQIPELGLNPRRSRSSCFGVSSRVQALDRRDMVGGQLLPGILPGSLLVRDSTGQLAVVDVYARGPHYVLTDDGSFSLRAGGIELGRAHASELASRLEQLERVTHGPAALGLRQDLPLGKQLDALTHVSSYGCAVGPMVPAVVPAFP